MPSPSWLATQPPTPMMQVAACAFLSCAPAAELREHLLLRLLAHRAGVEQQDVGLRRIVGQLVALRLAQHVRHLGGVVLVHLAAEGLDEEQRAWSQDRSGYGWRVHRLCIAQEDRHARIRPVLLTGAARRHRCSERDVVVEIAAAAAGSPRARPRGPRPPGRPSAARAAHAARWPPPPPPPRPPSICISLATISVV